VAPGSDVSRGSEYARSRPRSPRPYPGRMGWDDENDIEDVPVRVWRDSYRAEFAPDAHNDFLAVPYGDSKVALYRLLVKGDVPELVAKDFDVDDFPDGRASILRAGGWLVSYRPLTEAERDALGRDVDILVARIVKLG
jgi:hypothetical protein